MLDVLPPWDDIEHTSRALAECADLLRELRARLVTLARRHGATLEGIGAEAGVCRQRVAQWEIQCDEDEAHAAACYQQGRPIAQWERRGQ